MRAVVQRVLSASVSIPSADGEEPCSEIGPGYLILLGIRTDDTDSDVRYLAEKITSLRIFDDSAGKLNLSLLDVRGAALIVSNFTLYADSRKGRRPSFTEAASGHEAERLYSAFGAAIEAFGVETCYGSFGSEMKVTLVNHGPVTVLLDSRKQF